MTLLTKPIFVAGAIAWLFSSCGMVSEDAAPIPAYICVPSYTFVTDTSSFNASIYQGANSERFLDMWFSDAGKTIGGVKFPSLLPFQKIGTSQLWVEAGISITGQDEKREAYPLVSQHIEVRDFKPGVIDTVYPVFKYLPNIDFKFIEDFDRPGSYMRINPSYKTGSDTVLKVNDNRAWQAGKYSGKIEIDPSHQILQLISNEYLLPRSGSPVYLELDYKSNLPLDIGYYYQDPTLGASNANSVIQTFPNSEWKKLYVRLTDEVASRKEGTLFIIYIGLYNLDNIVPDVFIDNVKLVCLKV
jgi:hypothetical protein